MGEKRSAIDAQLRRSRPGSGTNPCLAGTTSTPARRRDAYRGCLIRSWSITPLKENPMKNADSPNHVVVSRPNITLLMVLCGIVSAAAAGAVNAATPDDDVPRLVVRYNAQSLATESGARALYRRLVSLPRADYRSFCQQHDSALPRAVDCPRSAANRQPTSRGGVCHQHETRLMSHGSAINCRSTDGALPRVTVSLRLIALPRRS